ncbi:hypothetical protein LSTR_LSTR016905 [Laodelphax striatellus]|uniref:Uncharacterized protein n=1 Tax=Laodelphax striatellus TaxID=195883 RepID=A0A482XKF4_LAOST|nr:hypothetical protein LSTR_LSTR016905 [Laodelphax striatellus]
MNNQIMVDREYWARSVKLTAASVESQVVGSLHLGFCNPSTPNPVPFTCVMSCPILTPDRPCACVNAHALIMILARINFIAVLFFTFWLDNVSLSSAGVD